jgi:hypothetical protein
MNVSPPVFYCGWHFESCYEDKHGKGELACIPVLSSLLLRFYAGQHTCTHI